MSKLSNSRKVAAKEAGESRSRAVRYGVAGLGYIAQGAVLPAFAHARKNSRLTALISGDAAKLKALGKKYGVSARYDYADAERCFRNGEIDALYVATPNSEHLPIVQQAARAGVHILCEKPLGVTEAECRKIIKACDDGGVKLMTAYRLHFEAANLDALKIARSGKLGELRAFNAAFTMHVHDSDNIRLQADLGGGPLHDIGIYCINAARTLFHDEPVSVFAAAANSGAVRFKGVDETVAVVMQFPQERLATFVCSFGAADVGYAHIIGTKGDLCLDPAYEYAEGLGYRMTVNGKMTHRKFAKRDQFAAELLYFSDCIVNNKKPEPSGEEGWADVRVIQALQRSIRSGRTVTLAEPPVVRHPTSGQRIDRPPVRRPRLVRASPPSTE